jgi:hypothetical protein
MGTHERHFTIRQLAELTSINYHVLRRRLVGVRGVVNLKTGKNNCLRIPESVWQREYERWKNRGRV